MSSSRFTSIPRLEARAQGSCLLRPRRRSRPAQSRVSHERSGQRPRSPDARRAAFRGDDDAGDYDRRRAESTCVRSRNLSCREGSSQARRRVAESGHRACDPIGTPLRMHRCRVGDRPGCRAVRAPTRNRSGRQPHPAFGAARGKDLAAADGFHTGAKSMRPRAADLRGLERTFHERVPSSRSEPQVADRSPVPVCPRMARPKSLILERVSPYSVNGQPLRPQGLGLWRAVTRAPRRIAKRTDANGAGSRNACG